MSSLSVITFITFLTWFGSSLVVDDSGLLPIKPGDMAITFYLTLRNDYGEAVAVEARGERCCDALDPTDPSACEFMRLVGGHMGTWQPQEIKNIFLFYPTLVPLGRSGRCEVELWFGPPEGRTQALSHRVPFDTVVRKGQLPPSVAGFEGASECRSADQDPLSGCEPVDCRMKYGGARPFWDGQRGRCLAAPACSEPDVAYDPAANVCRDLRRGLSPSEEAALRGGSGECSQAPQPREDFLYSPLVRCHHGVFNQDTGLCECDDGWGGAPDYVADTQPSTFVAHMCTVRVPPCAEHALLWTLLLGVVAALLVAFLSLLAYHCWSRPTPRHVDDLCICLDEDSHTEPPDAEPEHPSPCAPPRPAPSRRKCAPRRPRLACVAPMRKPCGAPAAKGPCPLGAAEGPGGSPPLEGKPSAPAEKDLEKEFALMDAIGGFRPRWKAMRVPCMKRKLVECVRRAWGGEGESPRGGGGRRRSGPRGGPREGEDVAQERGDWREKEEAGGSFPWHSGSSTDHVSERASGSWSSTTCTKLWWTSSLAADRRRSVGGGCQSPANMKRMPRPRVPLAQEAGRGTRREGAAAPSRVSFGNYLQLQYAYAEDLRALDPVGDAWDAGEWCSGDWRVEGAAPGGAGRWSGDEEQAEGRAEEDGRMGEQVSVLWKASRELPSSRDGASSATTPTATPALSPAPSSAHPSARRSASGPSGLAAPAYMGALPRPHTSPFGAAAKAAGRWRATCMAQAHAHAKAQVEAFGRAPGLWGPPPLLGRGGCAVRPPAWLRPPPLPPPPPPLPPPPPPPKMPKMSHKVQKLCEHFAPLSCGTFTVQECISGAGRFSSVRREPAQQYVAGEQTLEGLEDEWSAGGGGGGGGGGEGGGTPCEASLEHHQQQQRSSWPPSRSRSRSPSPSLLRLGAPSGVGSWSPQLLSPADSNTLLLMTVQAASEGDEADGELEGAQVHSPRGSEGAGSLRGLGDSSCPRRPRPPSPPHTPGRASHPSDGYEEDFWDQFKPRWRDLKTVDDHREDDLEDY